MYADLRINPSDASTGKVALEHIPAGFVLAQESKAAEFLVVSVDGDTNAPLAKLDELPEPEYNAVLAEIQKIRVPLVPKS